MGKIDLNLEEHHNKSWSQSQYKYPQLPTWLPTKKPISLLQLQLGEGRWYSPFESKQRPTSPLQSLATTTTAKKFSPIAASTLILIRNRLGGDHAWSNSVGLTKTISANLEFFNSIRSLPILEDKSSMLRGRFSKWTWFLNFQIPS